MSSGFSFAVFAFLLGLPGLAAPLPGTSPASDLVVELEADLDRGEIDGAIRTGERAVESDPTSSVAHDLLGRAYGLKAQESHLLEQVRLARKARAFFQKSVELDPANVSARADLATYDMRAPAFLGGGKEKARRQAEEVLRLDPARGYELLGALAEREKNPAAAESAYRRAVEASSPGQRRARPELTAFLVRQKRYAEARAVWTETRGGDSADAFAEFELAGVALASGEGLEVAVSSLAAFVATPQTTRDPSPAQVHERLARLEERLGQRERARAELAEALRLEPHRTDWRKSLALLAR